MEFVDFNKPEVLRKEFAKFLRCVSNVLESKQGGMLVFDKVNPQAIFLNISQTSKPEMMVLIEKLFSEEKR